MARGVNKVILVGNLGVDPEVKYTQGGMAICSFSLATSSSRKGKDGEQVETTEWHRVKLFGKLGEIAGEYLKKGRQVYLEGSIRYGKYTDKQGVERYTTDIVCEEMQMLGGQPGGGDRQERPESSAPRSSGQPSRSSAGDAYRNKDRAPPPSVNEDFVEDDIPF